MHSSDRRHVWTTTPVQWFEEFLEYLVSLSWPWWYICIHASCTITANGRWAWWRHQMETFSALLALCAGNSPVTCECPTQRPVVRSFYVFFHLCVNKWFRTQSWGWWFEMSSRPLWRHCNAIRYNYSPISLLYKPRMIWWLINKLHPLFSMGAN